MTDRSKENLDKILEQIKEDTGLDLTGMADKVIIKDVNDVEDLSPETIESWSDLKGTASDEEVEAFEEILKANENEEVSDYVKLISILHTLDGWKIYMDIEELSVIAETFTEDVYIAYHIPTSKLVYSMDKKENSAVLVFELEQDDKDYMISIISILCGHINILRSQYDYILPPLSVCEKLAEEMYDAREGYRKAEREYKLLQKEKDEDDRA